MRAEIVLLLWKSLLLQSSIKDARSGCHCRYAKIRAESTFAFDAEQAVEDTMIMKVIDLSYDNRIFAYCATAVCTYEWYINATRGAEANLEFQRAIIKDSKSYKTLRADLRRGCVLPPVVLAMSGIEVQLEPESVSKMVADDSTPNYLELEQAIKKISTDNTYIIDGLQRTNAIRQTSTEYILGEEGEKREFLERKLRVEIWVNISFSAIAYRMLLLNAGQKPMSIKHQIEVLSMQLKENLSNIPGIEILLYTDSVRRSRGGQFSLAKLSQCFQTWLQGNPNIDVRNSVMEVLLAESAIDTLGKSLAGRAATDEFKQFVNWVVDMDRLVYDSQPNFFSNETVLLGLSAAAGYASRKADLKHRMLHCLRKLKDDAMQNPGNALAIQRFEELRKGADVRKINVGQFARDMTFRAFQEYFLSDGSKDMEDCWAFGAMQP